METITPSLGSPTSNEDCDMTTITGEGKELPAIIFHLMLTVTEDTSTQTGSLEKKIHSEISVIRLP